MPVSVASAERLFSGLRGLKTYLRSNMSETRLSGLALLHVHHDTDIGILEIVYEFDTCGRRIGFLHTPEPLVIMFQMYFLYECCYVHKCTDTCFNIVLTFLKNPVGALDSLRKGAAQVGLTPVTHHLLDRCSNTELLRQLSG